jgi:hypothetical protein
MVLSLLQLLFAVLAIYGALDLSGELRLLFPLGMLIAIFILGRIDKVSSQREQDRKDFLRNEMKKVGRKDTGAIREQNFFTIDSLLWPKNELLLVDAVHVVFKDLGFKVSGGVNYQSVDRIVKIPESSVTFGLEIMSSEAEAEKGHPKVDRALRFEKEKKEGEKTLVVASTHTRLPLAEKGRVNDLSKDLADLLSENRICFLTTYYLYHVWQKTKNGEIDIFDLFERIYSQPGGLFPPKGTFQWHFPPTDQAPKSSMPR